MKIIALLDTPSDNSGTLPFIPFLSYPDSVMVRSGNPVFLPEFDSPFNGYIYLAVKISRLGKSIAERFAGRYYSQVAPVFVSRPDALIGQLSACGLPWTAAACFDRSIVVGDFRDYSEVAADGKLTLTYTGLSEISASLPSEKKIALAIQEVSRNNALKMGDLILLPLSFTPFPLHLDSGLILSVGEEVLLKTAIK